MPLIYNDNSLFLWRIDETEQQLLVGAKLCLEQHEHLAKLTHKTHRLQWLAARNIAAIHLHTSIYYKPTGAPMLTNSSLNVSISHTDNYVALYTASHKCGVDIELLSRNAEKIARRFTSHTEVDIARKLLPENPHLLIWCAKETLYKAAGIDGAEFLKDLIITGSNNDDTITATAFEEAIPLKFFVLNNLLVTYNYKNTCPTSL